MFFVGVDWIILDVLKFIVYKVEGLISEGKIMELLVVLVYVIFIIFLRLKLMKLYVIIEYVNGKVEC